MNVPRIEGGNVIVEVYEEYHNQGVQELKYNVVGNLTLQRGGYTPTTMELESKFYAIWKTENVKVILLGKAMYQVVLRNLMEQNSVLSMGTLCLKSGIFKVQRWIPGYNSINVQTNNDMDQDAQHAAGIQEAT